MSKNTQDTNNIPELLSPFERLKETGKDGKKWWNSRKLARVIGYGKYWNFERVIAKAQAWTSQKGYHLGEHFVEITEMAELGSGAVRAVTSIRLSRAVCMAVAMIADQKKEMVKAAQQYFSATMTPDVAVRSMESSILMYKGGLVCSPTTLCGFEQSSITSRCRTCYSRTSGRKGTYRIREVPCHSRP